MDLAEIIKKKNKKQREGKTNYTEDERKDTATDI